MPPRIQRIQQLALAQGQQAQHAVVHGQFALTFDFAQQAAAVTARGLQGATGNGTGQRRRAQGQAADHQVHTRPRRGACGNTAAHPHAQLLEGFRVEQVIAPAPVQQRQIAGRCVAGAKAIELEQGFDATLFTLANGLSQLVDGVLLGTFFADYAAPTRGAINQQFGDQAQCAVLARHALSLLVSDQALQRVP